MIRYTGRGILLAFCFAFCSTALVAEAAQPATSPAVAPLTVSRLLSESAGERILVMSNGLTVILKVHRSAPVVSVRMYCRTGSVYEQEYAGAGLSHLFEHLLHGGTTRTRTEDDSKEILARIGGNSNAFTSFGVTAYFINTAKEHMGAAVDLLSDWITNPTFPDGPFKREWGVVQRELERDLDDPGRQSFNLLQQTMFLKHPARFPVIGNKQAVQSLTKDDIVKYYRRMYVPDNVLVTIVGDLDLDQAQALIARSFSSFEQRPVPTITLPEEPPMTSPRMAVKKMKVESAMMQMAWPSIPLAHPDLYALDLLSYVLTEGESSCLIRSLVREQQLAFMVNSSSWTPEWGPGVFFIATRMDPKNVEAVQSAVWTEIRRLQAELITEDELQQARRQMAAHHVFERQTAEQIAEAMAGDYLATGDAHFSEHYVARMQEVTAEQVRDVARNYLRPERTGMILILPEDQASPGAEVVGAETDPAKMIVLDNGLRVLLRRDTASPIVAMQMFCLGGLLLEDPSNNGISNITAELMLRGTKTRSADEIARFFDARGAGVKAASGSNTLYVRCEVLKEDFDDAMSVFADVINNPAFTAEELNRLKPRVLNAISQINENWRSELSAYFLKKFYTTTPYRMLPIGDAASVKSLDPAAVSAFYHRMLAAQNCILAIYGDIDETRAEQAARTLFAALPPKASKPRPTVEPEKTIETPALYIRAKSSDRKAAGIYVGFRGATLNNTTDRYPLMVLDTIMGGYMYPAGWLHETLRGGQRDLVYEVHTVNVVGVEPGYFGMYAACQPEKLNEVYRIMAEKIDLARSGKFEQSEFEQAKGIILTTDLMETQTSGERAMQASLDELYGLGFDHRDHYSDAIRAVTMDDVRRVAQKYLTNPVIAVVTPSPDTVRIGIEPVAVEADAPATNSAAGGTTP